MKSVLSIAASDPSGGAGIQADIKTIAANGLYAQTAITAITIQNTKGVSDIDVLDKKTVSAQINAVFEDIRPDAVKIGALATNDIALEVCKTLVFHHAKNIVLDPVFSSSSGTRLGPSDVLSSQMVNLYLIADVITPNITEAEKISGFCITRKEDIVLAAKRIAEKLGNAKDENGSKWLGANSVKPLPAIYIKGGHMKADSASCDDFLLTSSGGEVWIRGPRIENPNSHGTGCTLSSAIACGLAENKPLLTSCRDAKGYLADLLINGLNLGEGSGPLNHMARLF